MNELVPFTLEDFFDQYEHRDDLINLASSDSLPWTIKEIESICPEMRDTMNNINFRYPNVKEIAIPVLRSFCEVPVGKDVLPTSGAAEAIFIALEEIMIHENTSISIAIPYPGYGSFEGISKLLGFRITPYRYRREKSWTVDSEELITLAQQCSVFVINTPHNPTGQIMDTDLLTRIAKAVTSHNGTLIVDEVFRDPQESPSSLGITENIVVIGSLSKMYGLPGLRFGWIVGAKNRIVRMRTVQQYLALSLPSLTAELGSRVAQEANKFSRRQLLLTNRQTVRQWAREHANILTVTPPDGGTTVCLEVMKSMPEDLLFEAFLQEKVLLVPGGRCFGTNGQAWFRLGYGAETEKLREGLRRLVAALDRIESR